MELLELERVSKFYGGLAANASISCKIREGEIVSLIGPNGAGKTTLFNVITGVERPDGGAVVFDGRHIGGQESSEIARLGLVRTFQQTKIFRDVLVRDAVVMGRHLHDRVSLLQALVWGPAARAARRAALADVARILGFVGMSVHAGVTARNLAYGDQKLLGIAIALAARPRLLLLDEPAAGMNAAEAARLMEIIRKIRGNGITVALVEHNMRLVMSVSDRVLVLNYGELIAEGTPEQVRRDPEVLRAYLGSDAHA